MIDRNAASVIGRQLPALGADHGHETQLTDDLRRARKPWPTGISPAESRSWLRPPDANNLPRLTQPLGEQEWTEDDIIGWTTRKRLARQDQGRRSSSHSPILARPTRTSLRQAVYRLQSNLRAAEGDYSKSTGHD